MPGLMDKVLPFRPTGANLTYFPKGSERVERFESETFL